MLLIDTGFPGHADPVIKAMSGLGRRTADRLERYWA
jgi:hypothetical protein